MSLQAPPGEVGEPQPILLEKDIPFTNRQDVLDEIINPLSPSYYLLDGPSGYGKTRLLIRLGEIFRNRNFVCGYVSAQKGQSLREIVRILCDNLTLNAEDIIGAEQRAKMLGIRFANALLNKTQQVFMQTVENAETPQIPVSQGIVLLFDDIGPNVREIAEALLSDFIPITEEILRGISFFRVVLSGRYLAQFASSLRIRLQPRIKVLEPFDYDVVRDSVLKISPFLRVKQDWREAISAHMMYLTGGHPECMAQVLNLFRQNRCKPQEFLELFSNDIWNNIVGPKASDIRRGISEHLLPVFDRLNVFRFFNTSMLRQLIKQGVIQYNNDAHNLGDELTGTYLYNREKRLLRDAVTRRLLVLHLRHNVEVQQFKEFCQEAYSIYQEFLKDERLQERELWTIECLYQALQQHANSIETQEQRSNLRVQYLNMIVPTVVESFVMEREEVKQELEALIYEMDRDWELQFTVNYYLRDDFDSYNGKPFADLKNKIISWSKGV